MASKKLPEHVHCAKCGYRGIDQNHDCTKVRASTAAVVDQAARRSQAARHIARTVVQAEPVDSGVPGVAMFVGEVPMADNEAPLPSASRLLRLAIEHARLFGRRLAYSEILREGGAAMPSGLIEIQQRCACCCGDINKRVRVNLEDAFFGLELGAVARKAYLQHRCPPVSDSLIGFTYEELEDLKQDLERDAQRMMERVAAIDVLEKARAR